MNQGKSPVAAAEEGLALRYLEIYPESVARVIEQRPADQVVDFLDWIGPERAIPLVGVLLPYYVARLCAVAATQASVQWLEPMKVRRLTVILRFLDKPKRRVLLEALPLQIAAACRVFLNYPENTVGAWMSDYFTVLPDNITITDALERLQEPGYLLNSDAIPVVDAEHHLKGIVSYLALSSANKSKKITEVMERDFPILSARASLASAQQHRGWSRYDTLSVLNRDRQLVGVLRHVHLRDSQEHLQPFAKTTDDDSSTMLAALSESYLQVLGTSFDWVGETVGHKHGLAAKQQENKS